MKLQSLLPHRINTVVSVNGTEYRVDGKGIVNVTNEQDALKLLANAAGWKRYIEREPIAVKAVEAPAVALPSIVEEDTSIKEYPDPTMKMSVSELREIADAYQVEYDAKTSKKVLVDLIMIAMYGE